MPRLYANMRERILANSRVNHAHVWNGVPCRDWTGAVFARPGWPDAPRDQRYGKIAIRFKRGPRKGKVKAEGAHRASKRAFNPKVRVGTKNIVRHICHRPICVENAHLMGGVQKSNVRDAVKAGRHKTPFRRKRGERYTAARAT